MRTPNGHVHDLIVLALVSTGLFAAALRGWDLLVGPIGVGAVTACAGLVFGGACVLSGFTRQTNVDQATRRATVDTFWFGHRMSIKTLDLSRGAWVRARLVGGYGLRIVVEVGTSGYACTEVMTLPYRFGKGVSLAETWCVKLAEHLQLPNKGFKGRA